MPTCSDRYTVEGMASSFSYKFRTGDCSSGSDEAEDDLEQRYNLRGNALLHKATLLSKYAPRRLVLADVNTDARHKSWAAPRTSRHRLALLDDESHSSGIYSSKSGAWHTHRENSGYLGTTSPKAYRSAPDRRGSSTVLDDVDRILADAKRLVNEKIEKYSLEFGLPCDDVVHKDPVLRTSSADAKNGSEVRRPIEDADSIIFHNQHQKSTEHSDLDETFVIRVPESYSKTTHEPGIPSLDDVHFEIKDPFKVREISASSIPTMSSCIEPKDVVVVESVAESAVASALSSGIAHAATIGTPSECLVQDPLLPAHPVNNDTHDPCCSKPTIRSTQSEGDSMLSAAYDEPHSYFVENENTTGVRENQSVNQKAARRTITKGKSYEDWLNEKKAASAARKQNLMIDSGGPSQISQDLERRRKSQEGFSKWLRDQQKKKKEKEKVLEAKELKQEQTEKQRREKILSRSQEAYKEWLREKEDLEIQRKLKMIARKKSQEELSRERQEKANKAFREWKGSKALESKMPKPEPWINPNPWVHPDVPISPEFACPKEICTDGEIKIGLCNCTRSSKRKYSGRRENIGGRGPPLLHRMHDLRIPQR